MQNKYKFYSEKLKRVFDTVEELEAAEAAADEKELVEKKKKQERGVRAAEVETAFKEAAAAEKKANNLLAKFVKDYGSFHTSIDEINLDDLFTSLVKKFWR